ncbi:MAG: spherulation-specific family 4 protein [Leptolyngbya sp. IPPAS B-1204]|nr:MAG: hypothetical protein EDM05_12590 [Leptolyngbya sp. IPPAS B-1204]
MPISNPRPAIDLLVPAYIEPNSRPDDWRRLIEVAKSLPSNIKLRVVFNPSNGPGSSLPAAYTGLLTELKNAGALIYGYVTTGIPDPQDSRKRINGGREPALVKADVNTYYGLTYGIKIDGIFLDEMAISSNRVGHYQDIYRYIKDKDRNASVIGNPGGPTIEDYLKPPNLDPTPTADILCTFEQSGSNYRSTNSNDRYRYNFPPGVNSYSAKRFAHLIHTESQFEDALEDIGLAKSRNVGAIYITDQSFEANPWDNLASYWPLLAKAITRLDLIGTIEETAAGRIEKNDNIQGGADNDLIAGLGGNDSLYCGIGNDICYGGKGADTLVGGSGTDTLIGGNGNDALIGFGPGSEFDVLTGGSGADRFYFRYDPQAGLYDGDYYGIGYARITDFRLSEKDTFGIYGSITGYSLLYNNWFGSSAQDTAIVYNTNDYICILQDVIINWNQFISAVRYVVT